MIAIGRAGEWMLPRSLSCSDCSPPAASNVFSNIYHVYQAEIFPSDVRATAVGWTYSVSRLSSAALPFILIPALDNYGLTAMFAVVLAALAVTVAVIAPIGPRTTGRSLDDITRRDRGHRLAVA